MADCNVCGKPVKRRCRIFCSRACRGTSIVGPRNPHWHGGTYRAFGYVMVNKPAHERANNNRYVREHILVAERAIGGPLPPKAVVHHHDEDRANNTPANLVICQDGAYHQMLHARMRFIADGVDPNTEQRCTGKCRTVKPLGAFYPKLPRWNGRYSRCIECDKSSRADKRKAEAMLAAIEAREPK